MTKVHLSQLRQQRSKVYWKSMALYLRYLGGSLAGFILIFGVCLFGYGYFVNHLPERFPVFVLMAILLAIPINSCHIRTYLREADVVFLLPMESQMSAYLQPSIRSAFLIHTLMMTLIWFLLWPLYQAAGGQSMVLYAIIWLQLVLIQRVVTYGVWQETQIRELRERQIVSWIRSITIGLLIYIILTQSIAWSLIAVGVASILYVLVLQATDRYMINWDRLIMLEHKSRSRWITFCNLFIEVPREFSNVRQTRWLHGMARYIAFKNSNAYRYLYLLTWMRSDLFGVIIRLTFVGVLLMVIMNNLWIKLGLILVFTYVIKLQLSELSRYHMNVETSSIYPLQQEKRASSARYVARRVHVSVITILIVSFLIAHFTLYKS